MQTISVSLKDTIYSGKRAAKPKVTEPVSLLKGSWVTETPIYKEKLSKMNVEQIAQYNVNMEKRLAKERVALEVPATHTDVSTLFNSNEEFVSPSNIVFNMKEREKVRSERWGRREERSDEAPRMPPPF